MAADGSLPAELARTRPFHYSFFSLVAMTRMASLSACVDVDLWQLGADGRGIAALAQWLRLYLVAPESWTRRDVDWRPERIARFRADWNELCATIEGPATGLAEGAVR